VIEEISALSTEQRNNVTIDKEQIKKELLKIVETSLKKVISEYLFSAKGTFPRINDLKEKFIINIINNLKVNSYERFFHKSNFRYISDYNLPVPVAFACHLVNSERESIMRDSYLNRPLLINYYEEISFILDCFNTLSYFYQLELEKKISSMEKNVLVLSSKEKEEIVKRLRVFFPELVIEEKISMKELLGMEIKENSSINLEDISMLRFNEEEISERISAIEAIDRIISRNLVSDFVRAIDTYQDEYDYYSILVQYEMETSIEEENPIELDRNRLEEINSIVEEFSYS